MLPVTLGSPPVSPRLAGCHVPVSPRQRRARQRRSPLGPLGIIFFLLLCRPILSFGWQFIEIGLVFIFLILRARDRNATAGSVIDPHPTFLATKHPHGHQLFSCFPLSIPQEPGPGFYLMGPGAERVTAGARGVTLLFRQEINCRARAYNFLRDRRKSDRYLCLLQIPARHKPSFTAKTR